MNTSTFVRVCASLAVGAGAAFAANAANEWSYADGKIAKGDWSVVATAFDSAAGTLALGAIESVAEDGVLDMRDMTVGGAAITALTLPKGSAWENVAVKEFYADHVANTALDALFGQDTDFAQFSTGGNTSITRVEVKSDTVETVNNFVAGCDNLKHLVLDCPKLNYYSLTPFAGTGGFTNDIQDVVKPWATLSSGDVRGFRFQYGLGSMTGSLVLTNVAPHAAVSASASSVTNVWIRWGGTTYPDLNLANVETVKIEMPNVVKMGTLSSVKKAFDVGEFIPKSIASIGSYTIKDSAVTGTLTLTNLTEVTNNGPALGICYATRITGGDFAGPIESMFLSWAQNGSAWTNVALDCPMLTNIVASAFYFDKTAGVPLELKVYGPVNRKSGHPWTQELVDNILSSVDAVTDLSAMKMTFLCSRRQGWDGFAGCTKLSALAAEERAKAPTGCFGVYKTAAGATKAWMVHMPQDTDPSGTCLIIR